MEDLTRDWPVGLTFAFLFVVALLRGSLTFAIGHGLRRAGDSRAGERPDRPGMVRAEKIVRRAGPPAVSLGFLTVGLQTAINLTAGLLRMPLSRFVPAVVVGALLWATIYTTIGFAVVDAALGRWSWWWITAAALAVLVVVAASRLAGRDRTGSGVDEGSGD